ncbi:recombination mediator RecR [Sulfurospirillum sp. 1612]|uniref:recombination mediator RecR n=1 Tax=Sulfurospirillum sp. 1612 TaxID=3094835 RepID=UPI002F947F13
MKQLEKFNDLVEAFQAIPTVGKKSALRFAYHLVLNDTFLAMKLANSIETAVKSIKKCQNCGALSENEICEICLDEQRDQSKICLVENAKDILILEENHIYNGKYFVLENIEPDNIEKLKDLVKTEVKEVIFALTPSLSNDVVIMFIEDSLKEYSLSFTKIAQGVPTGVHLENVDILSLSKAMDLRVKI